MTTPDKDLAARLAFIAASHDELQIGKTVEKAAAEMELRYHLHAAYRSNQLITTAEADARVEAAVLAEHNRCVDAIKNARARNTKIGSVEWALACEMIAAIRSRGVTG